jgi:hypothetical protein
MFYHYKINYFHYHQGLQCGQTSILPSMENVDDQPYEKTILNPYLLVESHLHDDVDAKEAFNHVLQKNINSSTTYV